MSKRLHLTLLKDGKGILSTDYELSVEEAEHIRAAWRRFVESSGVDIMIVNGDVRVLDFEFTDGELTLVGVAA